MNDKLISREFVESQLREFGVPGMVNGIWGTLAVGLFSTGNDGVGCGLFYGGGITQLGIQAIGVGTVLVYVTGVMFVVFKLIDLTIGLRVSEQVEIDGLDIHVETLSAYALIDIPVNEMRLK